jgi:hypothetical protein
VNDKEDIVRNTVINSLVYSDICQLIVSGYIVYGVCKCTVNFPLNLLA